MRKPWIASGCVAIAALALSACSSKSSSSATTAAPAASTAAPTTIEAPITTTEAPTTTTEAPTTTVAETTTSAAASAQTVTITPATGLTDGQTVNIVATGYVPGGTYGVAECADKGIATGAGDCNIRGTAIAHADSTGTVTTTFKVAKGPFGSNNIVCSASQKCLVSVAEVSGTPTHIASENISFA